MKKRIFTKVIAVVMTLIMMMSLFAPVVSAAWTHDGHTHDKNEINYVSLGDSMTNGYGLPGYNGNNGVEDYGNGSYANLFAKWLEDMDNNVNHAQLAMSAMRAEDIHWVLEVDYTDPAVIEVIKTLEKAAEEYEEDGDEDTDPADAWDEDLWYSVFTNGDYWTWHELVHNYRFDIAAACIKNWNNYGYNGADNNVSVNYDEIHAHYTDVQALEIVAEYFQSKVTEADIVSLCIGNGNFGVFMFNRLLEAMKGNADDALRYDVDRALAELDPAIRKEAEVVISDVEEIIDQKLGTMVRNADLVRNVVLYTVISLVVNYAGALEAILALNPDAEIVLLELVCTTEGTGENAALTIGSIFSMIAAPMNAYIAALPTVMQKINHNAYADATFYYADIPQVESLVGTFGDDFYLEDGKSNGNSIIRDRFYRNITGEIAGISVWEMLGSVVSGLNIDGVELIVPTYTEVLDYDDMTKEDQAEAIAEAAVGGYDDALSKYISCAMYLAIEKALVDAGKLPNTLDSIMSFVGGDGLEDLFDGVTGSFFDEENVETMTAPYQGISATAIRDVAVSVVLEKLAEKGLDFFTSQNINDMMDGNHSIEYYLYDTAEDDKDGVYVTKVDAVINNKLSSPEGVAEIEEEASKALSKLIKDEMSEDAALQTWLENDLNDHATIDDCLACNNVDHTACIEVKEQYEIEYANNYDDALAKAHVEAFDFAKETIADEIESGITELKTQITTQSNAYVPTLCMALAIPEALSGALVDNPAIGGLLSLASRNVIASGMGSHPSIDGHKQIFEAVKTSYEKGHTAQDEINDIILPLINKYYEQAYAALLANGSIDTLKTYIIDAKGAIVSANNALDGFEVNIDLGNLKPLLSTELIALNATLDEILALIDTADTIDSDMWAALMGLEDDLNTHINNVQAIAKEIEFIATPYIEKAIDAVKYYSAIIDETATEVFEKVMLGVDTFKKVYLEFVEITCEQAGKISPALADAVRELLVDAPQDVLAILYAYGEDVVIKLCLAAADASGELYDALVTLAALVEEYGWDIYYAIKNSSEFDAAVNGVKALEEELNTLYAEVKSAPISTVLDYKQKIESIKAELETAYTGLYELAMSVVGTAKPVVADMLADAIDNVKEAVIELIGIGNEYSERLVLRTSTMAGDLLMSVAEHSENIGESVTAFIADVLYDVSEYINNVVADVELMIKAEINKLSAALDELKGELAARLGKDVETLSGGEYMSYSFMTLADGASSDDEDDRTIGDALGDLSDLVIAEIEEKIAEIERKIAELQAAIEKGLLESAAKIESLINEISQDVDEIVDYITTEGSILLDNTIKDLVDAAQSLKQSGIEIISAAYEQLTAEIKTVLDRTLYFDYTVSGDSNYLAIGNFAQKENYATILADKLGGINLTTFNNSGYRLADLRALLDEDFVNDAYGNQYFSKLKARSGNTLVEDIKAADVITVDLGMADFTTFATNQLIAKIISELDELKDVFEQFKPVYFESYTMYEMDWSYFGEFGEKIDVAAEIDYIFDEFIDERLPETIDIRDIVDLGITINVPCEISVKEMARYAVEVYLYAFANYAYNYWATVEAIQAVNPDAQLVLLGAYNMFDGFVFETEDFTLDMTYVGEAMMRVASALRFASAVANPGVVYIDVEDAGSDMSELEINDLITVDSDTMLIAFNANALGIKEEKNEYVAAQIFNAIDVTCEHIYDDCVDAECNFCGELREAPGHVYDDCEDVACNVCGALRKAQKHVYDADCTDATCNNCGKLRDAQAAHKYDDCMDTDCNNKGCKVTRTAPGHTFGEWEILKEATLTEEGEKQRTCTECGYTETAVIEKLVAPTPDDSEDEPCDDSEDDEDGFPIWLLCLMLLLVLVLIGVDVWYVFIKKQTETEPVEEPVEEIVEEPVEEEEEEIDVDAALGLVVLPDEDEFEGGVEVIEVIWAESSSQKVYRYDPNGMKVERGDIIRVPSRDAAKNRDVMRKVIVARGNHRVDPETLKHPLKKIDSVVSRCADTSAEDANN